MTSNPLPAHSLAEAYFYLLATRCPRCGRGPLRGGDAGSESCGDRVGLTIAVCCGSCGHQEDYRFRVDEDLASLQARQASGAAPRVNPTDEPSRIIDVAQWITLFRVITEAAAREPDKGEVRRLGYEAAQCLEEALKFYEEDNDLPPDSALFCESSRRMQRDHPHEFSRQRLVELRGRLPTLDAMEASQFVSAKPTRKRWWTWWQ